MKLHTLGNSGLHQHRHFVEVVTEAAPRRPDMDLAPGASVALGIVAQRHALIGREVAAVQSRQGVALRRILDDHELGTLGVRRRGRLERERHTLAKHRSWHRLPEVAHRSRGRQDLVRLDHHDSAGVGSHSGDTTMACRPNRHTDSQCTSSLM